VRSFSPPAPLVQSFYGPPFGIACESRVFVFFSFLESVSRLENLSVVRRFFAPSPFAYPNVSQRRGAGFETHPVRLSVRLVLASRRFQVSS